MLETKQNFDDLPNDYVCRDSGEIIKMVQLTLSIEKKLSEKLIRYAKDNIINDKEALLNWAINNILKEKIKNEKH